jgi:polysaccharide biosynthesis transport protein
MIQSLDLYPRERSRTPISDIVEKMKKNISIGNVLSYTGNSNPNSRVVPAFQIVFSYTDRYKAQSVVSELTAKFIDQNIRDRAVSSQGTTGLLRDQWDAAKKEMEMYETKLADFRTRHEGTLPDEVQSNLQQLNALQTRLMNLNSAISRVSQDKLMLEGQLRILKDQAVTLKDPVVQDQSLPKSEKVLEAEREVNAFERQLSMLREHYKDTYPGIQRTIGMLNTAKKKRDEAVKEDETRKPEVRQGNPMIQREQRDLDASAKRVQSQIEAKDLEAEEYRKEMAQASASLKVYEGRLGGIPLSEKEYAELIRDRDLARSKFLDLDSKMTRSNMADEMEKRKFGESLDILDSASLPQTPTEPKRPFIIAVGMGVGLFLGFALAGAREMKDTSLKNLKDVRAYTQLPILGSVPLLENDLVVKRRRRIAWLGWSIACMAGIAMMSGSVIYYFATRV